MSCPAQFVCVGRPKLHSTFLQYFAFEARAIEWRRNYIRWNSPTRRSVIVRSNATNFLRALIPWIEMRLLERPTVIGKIIALFEIDCIKGKTPSTPVIRRPAEKAQ